MSDLDVLDRLLEQTEKPRENHIQERSSKQDERDLDRRENKDTDKDEFNRRRRDDRYSSRRHSCSRSKESRRRYGRSRSRERERSYNRSSNRDYDRRYRSRRDRSRSRSRDRYSKRRSRDRLEAERKEREYYDKKYSVDEHERDLRTVFIRSLPTKADARDIKKWFENASAPVREVRLIYDKYSKKSKGFGYVEFYQKESISKAVALSGSQLIGKTVYVELSEAEKNIEASTDVRPSSTSTRIYINNLYHKVTEDMLRSVFEKFGEIEYLNLTAGNDQTRGFAFVQYSKRESASKSISMNGLEICGYAMKVGFVNANSDQDFRVSEGVTELEDVDYITKHQRYELMHSLSSRAISENGDDVHQKKIVSQESTCMVVQNMFDPEEEQEGFESRLAMDVKRECDDKYGEVEDVFVDKDSMGDVYIKYKNLEDAHKSFLGLNSRSFGKRFLSVRYIPLEEFLEKVK